MCRIAAKRRPGATTMIDAPARAKRASNRAIHGQPPRSGNSSRAGRPQPVPARHRYIKTSEDRARQSARARADFQEKRSCSDTTLEREEVQVENGHGDEYA